MAPPGRTSTLIRGMRAAVRHVVDTASGRVRVAFPAGHFYSPIPDLEEVRRRNERIFSKPAELPGIELRTSEQLALVDELAAFAPDAPFTPQADPRHRYYFENDFFGYGDALMLYAMLRHRRPRLVVEVGSGFSSALVLDTAEQWLPELELVFIEPYPQRLRSLLKPRDVDRAEIIEAPVQEIDLGVFDRLGRGDFLIIDSTHVAKIGSDVMTLVFDVLPRLRPGVVVHVHDILYPFEYPQAWVLEGRAWNEAYLLRAFLTGNAGYRIVLWNSYLDTFYRDDVGRKIPLWDRNTGGSIWLERGDVDVTGSR